MGFYADGPDVFSTDLAGSFDECETWRPAAVGNYQMGISFRTPPPPGTIAEIRIKNSGNTIYQRFTDEGTFAINVLRGKTTRVNTFIRP